MSKAFTKEDEGIPEPPPRRRGVPVPDGVPNLVTARGLRALRDELEALARDGRDPDRARELADHLATAQAAPEPSDDERLRVGFGATVVVEDEDGARARYRIVGAIEAAPKAGAISWQTPIANALWDARVGDSVELPRGEVEVVAIEWD